MIFSAVGSATRPARASAAASFMRVVMLVARASRAPRKTPGKARLLLIWLGKSLRPVPTTLAPASAAASGQISGVGLAAARTMGSEAMERTMSWETVSPTDRPMKTSESRMAAARSPSRFSWFVMSSISVLIGVRSGRLRWMMPWLSTRTMFLAP